MSGSITLLYIVATVVAVQRISPRIERYLYKRQQQKKQATRIK